MGYRHRRRRYLLPPQVLTGGKWKQLSSTLEKVIPVTETHSTTKTLKPERFFHRRLNEDLIPKPDNAGILNKTKQNKTKRDYTSIPKNNKLLRPIIRRPPVPKIILMAHYFQFVNMWPFNFGYCSEFLADSTESSSYTQ